MVSHKKVGDIELSVSYKGGLRFKRAPTERNICVANELRGKSYANRQAVRTAFTKASKKCGRPATKTPAKK